MDVILGDIYGYLGKVRVSGLHYRPFIDPVYVHHSRAFDALQPEKLNRASKLLSNNAE